MPEKPNSKSFAFTYIAFIAVVLIGGSNAVAVRFSNMELPPFFGATFRFAAAALIFWMLMSLRRVAIPTGRALFGAIIYGVLTIGVAYAFLYWGLLFVPASLLMVVLSLGPLLTFIFALLHKQESFRWLGLVGALVAVAGIVVIIGDQIGSTLPLLPLLAILGAAAAIAEGTVLYKSFPRIDPLAVNAISLTAGTILLALASLFAGEFWQLPVMTGTWVAFLYLVFAGSVGLFYLYLYVLNRWTASAASYAFLLFPISTIIISAILEGEQVTGRFLIGAAIVMLGVWIGAFLSRKD
jgi:drug/metabolite transporter (DMT)-like permease